MEGLGASLSNLQPPGAGFASNTSRKMKTITHAHLSQDLWLDRIASLWQPSRALRRR